jgi:hypothetical protein
MIDGLGSTIVKVTTFFDEYQTELIRVGLLDLSSKSIRVLPQ